MREVTLFAGPSLHRVPPGRVAAAGVQLLPPARRDDITRLVRQAARPGVILLCDGVFQCCPSVSHAELCAALDAGWEVWGVSSLGAIRAVELRHEGMRGFGRVHDLFAQGPGLTDDEACLLHYPEPPWFPVSEALVNVRVALSRRAAAFGIAPAAAAAVVAELGALWFGDRTHERIATVLADIAGLDPARVQGFLAWLACHPVKSLDLAALLRARPWLPPSGQVAGPPLPWPARQSGSSPAAPVR